MSVSIPEFSKLLTSCCYYVAICCCCYVCCLFLFPCLWIRACLSRFFDSTLVSFILEAPSFSKTSKEKLAAEGETAVLECMSSRPGVRPRLEWLKDGRPLSLTSRHYFAGDGQILVIRKTQPGDSGEYMCIMTNPLGSERAVLHLTVQSTSQLALQGNSSEGSQSDDITRIGIIVIVVVVCIVGTSLLWVIMIYCFRMKQRGRQAIKKTLPCRLYPLNDDVFIANNNSSKLYWL